MSVWEELGVAPPDPVVENKLFRDGRRVVTLLVESGYDRRFWEMHTAPDCLVRDQGQGGRQTALDRLARAAHHAETAIVAVLDADLDRAEGRLQERPDVVWTDAHDLETTLLGLPALEKLARHALGGDEGMAEREKAWGEPLRARLFAHGLHLGRLRWLKARGDVTLVFKKPGKGSRKGDVVRFGKYDACVGDNWAPSWSRAARAIANYGGVRVDLDGWERLAAGLPDADAAQVCNGHDLVGFLGVLFGRKDVDGALLLVTERAWLETTAMWAQLRAWEVAHPGFAVVAAG